jgi:hypothetical protein
MPSIAVHQEKQAVSAATAAGLLTVTSTTNLYPGANAWLATDNGSSKSRVLILRITSATQLVVRVWPTRKSMESTEPDHTLENYGAPNYGVSDVSAYNGSSHITMEAQSVPVDPAFSKRSVP